MKFMEIILTDGSNRTCGQVNGLGSFFEIQDTGEQIKKENVEKIVRWNGFESKVVYKREGEAEVSEKINFGKIQTIWHNVSIEDNEAVLRIARELEKADEGELTDVEKEFIKYRKGENDLKPIHLLNALGYEQGLCVGAVSENSLKKVKGASYASN